LGKFREKIRKGLKRIGIGVLKPPGKKEKYVRFLLPHAWQHCTYTPKINHYDLVNPITCSDIDIFHLYH
jgi:hypothetical protein